jgi:hypothetical protein
MAAKEPRTVRDAVRGPVSADAPAGEAADAPAQPPVEEEWPPREWREATRSAGHKQAGYVTLAMLVMFGALVAVAIWAAHNG